MNIATRAQLHLLISKSYPVAEDLEGQHSVLFCAVSSVFSGVLSEWYFWVVSLSDLIECFL